MELQEKKEKKIKSKQEKVFRKNLNIEGVYYILKAVSIIGQRKAFHRQRIPESSCARKETVDIDVLPTFRNGEREIMHSIRITSGPTTR